MSRSVIIYCAVTGAGDTFRLNPAVPVTPMQIAAECAAAAQAGAAIVHVHVRNPETGGPSMAIEHYREVVERIRASGIDVVINLTTGPGARYTPSTDDPRRAAPESTIATPEKRVEHVLALKPEVCSLDVATMNFGEHAFVNVPRDLRRMAELIRRSGAKPELEVFDLGHVRLACELVAKGVIDSPPLFQLCLGVPWGAPATPQTMLLMRDQLPSGAIWAGFGISRSQFSMAAQAVLLGGHVRVGLEDNLYLEQGKLAPGNAALVERAVRIVEALGERAATPAEARAILGLSKP
jgi:uncharacterized protein (DUF849 family)